MKKNKFNIMELLYGIIHEDGIIIADDGSEHELPIRGTDKDGYKEVLIDAKSGKDLFEV